MKRKFKMPILLLAVVVMLSIFYIKEGNSSVEVSNSDFDSLDTVTLDPKISEIRLEHLNEYEEKMKELENSVINSDSADTALKCGMMMDELEDILIKEMSLEDSLINEFYLDDCLVMYNLDKIVIHVSGDISSDIKLFKYVMNYNDGYKQIELIK